MNKKDDDIFSSSDSVRSGAPLKYAQSVTLDGPLKLELGGELGSVTVVYETYGKLNEARSNAVLICHALSGDSHVAPHDDSDPPGWWDIVVGAGKPIDTDKYFVICPNLLGGCRGTTGPNSLNPATDKPYGRDFPAVTVGDMVEVQRRLTDHLGIDKLLAVTGGSLGGQQVLAWATKYADRVCGAAPIATAPRLTSQALAFDIVGRNAILRDPQYNGGQYYEKDTTPEVGLAIARMIGHITYLSREAMREKFEATRYQPRDVSTEFEKKFSVGSYLGYQGAKFVERFDANSYITLSMAMDLFDIGDTPAELAEVLGRSNCRWLVISYSSDWLFPPVQSQQLVNALIAANRPVSYCNVNSGCGHDAFLLPNDLASYGGLISAFLANLNGEYAPARPPKGRAAHRATSIFHPDRLDYDRIAELIDPAAGVLDLGCGDGELLSILRQRGHSHLVGLELDEELVLACVQRGLDVVHADLNDGLEQFADGQFDFVVLSQTLQTIFDVQKVLADIVRVGKRCIVSFPNFAYHKLREMVVEQGRAPESAGILRHKWYNSPNIRFLSIDDFEDFCKEKGLSVHRRICLDTEAGREVHDEPNRNADLAIFVLSH